MAENPEVSVRFTPGPATRRGGSVTLPRPDGTPSVPALRCLRGEADGIALELRHHDPGLHAARAPLVPLARRIFDRLERTRCETLGARRLAGVRANLDAVVAERCVALAEDFAANRDAEILPEVLALLAREGQQGAAVPAPAAVAVAACRDSLAPGALDALDALASAVDDQGRHAQGVHRLLNTLGLGEAPETVPDDDPGQDEEQATTPPPGASETGARESGGGRPPEAAGSPAQGSRGQDETPEAGPSAAATPESPPTPGATGRYPRDDGDGASAEYRVFCTDFDEVVDAASLCESDELDRLRVELDHKTGKLRGVIARLANRLHRRLLARLRWTWDLDLEEGLLDTGRLARVVANPLTPLSYKRERLAGAHDTVVTLLIDNSGSMRGRPIMVAAASADILARTLERCGVRVEVLGFTTRAWKGGRSRERWIAAGRPPRPGRLNDLRHVVYKPADAPWRRARRNLPAMLREGLLKENIDGESLLWAHGRLLARPEERRILLVISDGIPLDDSTLAANTSNYLEQHLRQVIDYIETRSPVELVAIGIVHDVTRYYRRAVTLVDPEQLGSTLMTQMAELFDPQPGSPPASGREAVRVKL